MEYSLTSLTKLAHLNNLTLISVIDELNLIGFEVDDFYLKRNLTNKYNDDIKLLIKIPSNREDLLNENYFLRDLSIIFLFKLFKKWEQIKKNYSKLLDKKYKLYESYKIKFIDSDYKDIFIYRIKFKNIKYDYSPMWVQKKLVNSGISTCNNFMDIINLINLEWGQSFNIFTEEIPNNRLLSLNNLEKDTNILIETKNYNLKKNNIILSNEDEIVLSFLGYQENNKNIKDKNYLTIEGVYYDIHNNPLKINPLETKISLRHLRKASLENFHYSFQRLLTLLDIIYETKFEKVIEKTKTFIKFDCKHKRLLVLNKKLLQNILGVKIYDKTIFEKAGLIIVCETMTKFYFQISNYRHDLLREIDLVEEYSRFIGYKNFSEIIPKKQISKTNNKLLTRKYIRQFFLTLGFNEIITNPIREKNEKISKKIVIKNPLSNDFSSLRTDIISELIQTFELNYKLTKTKRNLFEIGRVFKFINGNIIEFDKLGGIYQLERIKKEKNQPTSEWFMAKGYLENFLNSFGYNENLSFINLPVIIPYFNPAKSMLIKYGSKTLGIFGELKLTTESKISTKFSTYIFELDLRFFSHSQLLRKIETYKDFSRYPSIIKDLSILISKKTSFSKLKTNIFKSSSLLKSIQFFDIYFKTESKNLSEINLGIRLEFQENEKTLTNEEVEIEVSKINHLLSKDYKAKIRR